MLIGISPQLEMALYTICFTARLGRDCYVSLGGKDFRIRTVTNEHNELRGAYFRMLDH